VRGVASISGGDVVSSWTPGPWYALPVCNGSRELWGDHDSPDQKYMGELDCSEADARLIAAAPELVAMLDEVTNRGASLTLGDGWKAEPISEVFGRARALLARIKGSHDHPTLD